MVDGNVTSLALARREAYKTPLELLDPDRPDLFQADTIWPTFERLRAEDPVHYTREHSYGPYWSITKYNDIVAIETNHHVFSSAGDGVTIAERRGGDALATFIAMDPPKHGAQRKTVSPALAPTNLRVLEPLIRERAAAILDNLPIGEEFDWVERVSKELTGMTLATLFGVPQEDRRKLTYWSDLITTILGQTVDAAMQQRLQSIWECHAYFAALWNERVNAAPASDLISMLAHGKATRNMDPREYIGNITLLMIGGNDTTRNTISASIFALNENPKEYIKLRDNPALIPPMVSETIRWQTPIAHMRRRALRDVEFQGKAIRKGDKVIMWYVSGNRDGEVIENPNAYVIDRERPRNHISFGFGIHRCVGNRLAELQLRVVWEEILKRFLTIEIVGAPTRTYSAFVRGYENMNVIIRARP